MKYEISDDELTKYRNEAFMNWDRMDRYHQKWFYMLICSYAGNPRHRGAYKKGAGIIIEIPTKYNAKYGNK